MMKLTESNFRALLVMLGYYSTKDWNSDRLQKKLVSLHEKTGDFEHVTLTGDMLKLYSKIIRRGEIGAALVFSPEEIPEGIVNGSQPKCRKGDRVVHKCGYVFRITVPPYTHGTTIVVRAIRQNIDGVNVGNIERIPIYDFVENAEKEKPQTMDKPKTKKPVSEKVKKAPRVYIRKVLDEYFDKVGIENVNFEDALEIARKAKSDTTFNVQRLLYYKHKYRKKQKYSKADREMEPIKITPEKEGASVVCPLDKGASADILACPFVSFLKKEYPVILNMLRKNLT